MKTHPLGKFDYYEIPREKVSRRSAKVGDVIDDDDGDIVIVVTEVRSRDVTADTWGSNRQGMSESWDLSAHHTWHRIGTVSPTPAQLVQATNQGGEVRITSETGGSKGTKPEQYDQFPVEALRTVAKVYAFGASKYEAHNFRKGYKWSLSFSALCRHLWAFWGGEDNDPESGLPHMGHVAWHALCLLSFQREHPEYDDRYSQEGPEAS